jgi:glycine/serine hydroxymethyltransferase
MSTQTKPKTDGEILLDALPELIALIKEPTPETKAWAQRVIRDSRGMQENMEAEGRRFWCGHT